MKEAKTALQSASFTEAALEGDDSRVTFYTGVPSFFMLLGIFNLVKDHISHSARHSLTQFEEMVVFLMRIRLGCPMQDLAFRFNVSQSTISRNCERWLDVFFFF